MKILLLIILSNLISIIYQPVYSNTIDNNNSIKFNKPVFSKPLHYSSPGLMNYETDQSDQKCFPRKAASDLKFAVTTYVKDTWTITKSPFSINRKQALYLGGITAVSIFLYKNEDKIFTQLHRHHENKIYSRFMDMGNYFEPIGYMGYTNRFYFAGLAVGYLFNINKLTRISAQILESHFIAGGFKNLANILVGRARPYERKGPYSFEYNEGSSFPSGHASTIFQLATILSYHVNCKLFSVAAYTIATSVCLQRIDSNSHWPSDVFLAAVYGTAISRTILKIHENKRVKPTLSYQNNTAIAGLSFKF